MKRRSSHIVIRPVLLPTSCAKATQRTPCSNARLVIMRGPISLPARCSGNCWHPPGREFLQSVGDQAGPDGEELAGLRYHPLARDVRLEQFSGSRKYGGREFLFETAGEQPFQDVVGGTQASDLFLPHGSDLMFGRRTRHRASADSIGMSVCDGERAGDEPVFIANLFGGGSVPACAYFGVQGPSPKFAAVPPPLWQIGAVPGPCAWPPWVLTCT